MHNQSETRYDIETVPAAFPPASKQVKGASWRWALFLLLVLTAILLLAGLGDGMHANLSMDGDVVGGVVGGTFAVLAVLFALVAFVLVLVGVSLLVVLIVVGVLCAVFLALTPIWLPMLLAIALLVWLVRKL